MAESRTKNTLKNVKTGFVVQLINKLMAFVVRTFFIMYLNTDYLGVNGLFTNVLTVLSFAELGIGTAIIFNMYKPVAENNKEEIKSLMALYKKAYNIIGFVVFGLGLMVIPFMNFIIKDAPAIKENIILIYLLFLINTSSSYFFTYKKSIISAHQKQNIINNIDSIIYIIKSIIEIVFLILTRNYILFLIIQISFTMLENIIISFKANKMFPYLKEKDTKKLEKDKISKIFSNVKALVVYQFGGIIMTGTDNILISALINVSTIGLCSNYTLIISSVKSIISSGLNGVIASVGNLNATGTKEKKEEIFYELLFIHFLIYSFCAIAFVILLNPFIKIWLGDNYLLGVSISVALAFNFFIDGMRNPGFIYRTTAGLFQKGKFTPYIGATTNIALSIILCKFFGVLGIFMATGISTLLSYSWIDPYLIHKYEFKKNAVNFYKKYAFYFIIFGLDLVITYFLTTFISFNIYLDIILKGLVALIIPNIINILVFRKSNEFIYTKEKFINKILRKLHLRKFA